MDLYALSDYMEWVTTSHQEDIMEPDFLGGVLLLLMVVAAIVAGLADWLEDR